ncbi:hypothetical protein P3X46_029429 [Hevea brasiliensis]|uniref:Uncharacterized protein n=1 Tax=Hevea brasiliensis TaxID=3981 RepID=A0ABQ9KT19_HEVBR|nr:uncharacterized protein LOC110672047 [Hevea brasiliensis]KAJ9147249.1 hypothetical protein P3X46_029429 [Hevea brasiliensis]
MPSIAPFNIFMDKRKPRSGTGNLSTVKAAAWAWYQHGSGSNEGKPINEFAVTRTRQAYRPSRYKLEAMKVVEECSIEESSQSPNEAIPVHTDSNSLLDAYEIESISKRLDCLIESSNMFCDRDNVYGDARQKNSRSAIKKNNKNILRGLWLRYAVVCGTREDVDTSAFVRSRPPPAMAATHAPVVKTAVCRPRAAHAQ